MSRAVPPPRRVLAACAVRVHENGWPACLEPRHPGFMRRSHEQVRFGFAEVSVDAGGFGWRPVVMVDCRPGTS